MEDLLLILVPLVWAAVAALWPDNRPRPWLLAVVGFFPVVLSFWLLVVPPVVSPGAWLAFDPLAP